MLFYLCFISAIKLSTIHLRYMTTIKSIYPSEGINHQVGGANFKNYMLIGDENQQSYFKFKEIFIKADSSNDGYLSIEEVSAWINTQIQEHIRSAITENYGSFTAMDAHLRNGILSWGEYHSFFPQEQDLRNRYLKGDNNEHKDLSTNLKETKMREKASKSEPDYVTLDEFLAFRNQESSYKTILALVEDLLDKFDRDGDDILTEDEFSSREGGNVNEKSDVQAQGESERIRKFREGVDQDNDGKASRTELMFYIDPKNPRYAKEEAEALIGLADTDHDGKLSLIEVFDKIDLFLGSKMVDIGQSIHDEF